MTRVGLVGSGFIAKQHLRSWRAIGAEVALFSLDGPEARRLGERYDLPVTATLDELLDRSEIVDVCTPTDQHASVVIAACERGIDVVCEKPLARTAAEASDIARRCDAAGVRLFPAHVVRYVPAYAAARAELDRGALGELAVVHLARSGPCPSWTTWITDAERSGGILMDLMIHDYDIALWFCGPVDRVFARASRSETGKNIGAAVLTHRSGAISHIRGAWRAANAPLVADFRLYGSGGYLLSGTDAGQELLTRDDSGGERRIPVFSNGAVDPFALELADFAMAAREGRAPRVSVQDGVEAVVIAEAACRSAATGTAVELSGRAS